MTLPNIGICGGLRSGKDTVGDYISQNYGYTQFAFGDELKNDFHRRYPEIPRDPKPRIGYQTHGQLMRRLIDEDIWVWKCFAEIKRVYYAHIPFRAVITDLRQPNEYDRCRAESYVIIRIKAPETLRIGRAIQSADTFNLRDLTHDTESHVDSFTVDYEIVNDGTLAELYAKVDAIMRELAE
jgi:dephospho-CoA kinase